MGLFSKSNSPLVVPEDEIIPLRKWDDAWAIRAFVLDLTMRFDDCLDVSKLRDSLDNLIGIGDWRQLGARLRKNRTGQLEYHIPRHYSASRAPFMFASSRHEISIKQHPLASRIPHATEKPAFLPTPDDFGPIFRHPEAPQKLEQWINSDSPQIFIHTGSFTDATLITVTWPHTLTDVMGISRFLDAWSAIVNGEEETVPRFRGFQDDPLTALAEQTQTPPEKYLHFNHLLSKLDLLRFVFWRVWDLIWFRHDERRTICLPKDFVDHLHTRCLQDVTESSDMKNATTPFISEGDVLLAWYSRSFCRALGTSPDRTVVINNVIDVRSALQGRFLSPQDAYLGNSIFMMSTLFQGRQIMEQPLGHTALQIRETVAAHRDANQVEAMVALHKRSMERDRVGAIVGTPGMQFMVCSNWGKAHFFQVDFSAAVVTTSQSHNMGRPSYVNALQHSHLTYRNTVSVLGRDTAGNLWLTGVLHRGAWAGMERELRSLKGSET